MILNCTLQLTLVICDVIKQENTSTSGARAPVSSAQRKKDAINTQIQQDLQKAEELSEEAKKGLAEGKTLQSSLLPPILISFNYWVSFIIPFYNIILSTTNVFLPLL